MFANNLAFCLKIRINRQKFHQLNSAKRQILGFLQLGIANLICHGKSTSKTRPALEKTLFLSTGLFFGCQHNVDIVSRSILPYETNSRFIL
jgi:hypothetical protein